MSEKEKKVDWALTIIGVGLLLIAIILFYFVFPHISPYENLTFVCKEWRKGDCLKLGDCNGLYCSCLEFEQICVDDVLFYGKGGDWKGMDFFLKERS